MNTQNPYAAIERELDMIIVSEISHRFDENRKKPGPDHVFDALEEKNRQIVEAHQAGAISTVLPSLFTAFLQAREDGELFLDESKLNVRQINTYIEKKGRFDVLLGASLNALDDPEIKQIIRMKDKTFQDSLPRAKQAMELLHEVMEMKKQVEKPVNEKPHDEASAVAFLKDLSTHKLRIGHITSRHIELQTDPYIAEPLQQLHHAIHLVSRSIAARGESVIKFVFDRASAVFYQYRHTKPEFKNIQLLMDQKEELERYQTLFQQLGEDDRYEKTGKFIASIDGTLGNIHKAIEKQKQAEHLLEEKNAKNVQAAYDRFLEIKQEFADGKIQKPRHRRKALRKLRKYGDVLKSNGRRVKAREIDRFLNSTGIAASNSKSDMETLTQKYKLYRNGFMALLPVTLLLAGFCAYLIITRN